MKRLLLSLGWVLALACSPPDPEASEQAALGKITPPAPTIGPDFNRDGYADVAIGIPGAASLGHPEAGTVRILYGGSNGLRQLVGGPVSTLSSSADHALFGSVLVYGDFDDNGWLDLAVSRPYFDDGAGEVLVYYGATSCGGVCSASPQSLSNVASWVSANAGHNGARFGYALAAGDFDDDGCDDLAVGAPMQRVSGHDEAGGVLLFLGCGSHNKLTFHSTYTEDDTGAGAEDGAGMGTALVGGDLDCDGHDDLAAGAPRSASGRVHLFLTGSAEVETVDGATVPYQDEVVYADFGASLAVGKVNGGSCLDLLIGAPSSHVEGGSVGYAGVAMLRYDNGTHRLFVSPAAAEYDRFGLAVSTADVDQDGRDDVLVGAPGWVDTGFGSGRLEVYETGGGTYTRSRIDQGSPGVPGAVEDGDGFGAVLTAGNFRGGPAVDVFVASPREGVGDDTPDAGMAHVLEYGPPAGGSAVGIGVDELRLGLLGGTDSSGARFASAASARSGRAIRLIGINLE